MEEKSLIGYAMGQLKQSYAPYSNFHVAAALLSKSGKVYVGSNIENASFSATVCAERVAFFRAVSEGEYEFSKIAIVGGKDSNHLEYCPPCGVCRQVMREFTNPEEFVVLIAKSVEDYQSFQLSELLPMSFGPDYLMDR